MRKHYDITKGERLIEESLSLRDLLKIRVLSRSGYVVGKVSQIRICPTKRSIEGVLVSTGIFKRPIYIGVSYIRLISSESFILNIDPSVLLVNRTVIDSDGKKVGKVKEVKRKGHFNDIEELMVGSPLRKNVSINISEIRSLGENIVLNSAHNEKKEYFWKKS